MKKRTGIIIILITLLLLLNGVVLIQLIRGQMNQLGRDQRSVAEAVVRDTAMAAETVAKETADEQEALAQQLAAEHVYAHRGCAGESLEHSFRAYDKAIAEGARYIEQDIVISKEGTLYVSHDQTGTRMTGDSRSFSDMTDAQIDQLRTHEGEPTLRLAEIFDRYGRSIHYLIELKSTDQETIDAFTSIVRQYHFEDQIIAQCFYMDTLQRLDERFPQMPMLYLCKDSAALARGIEAPCVDIVSAEISLMTESNVEWAHDAGKEFTAWTILSEDQMKQAIDLGVDGYFTDYVKEAISIEEEYGFEERYLSE